MIRKQGPQIDHFRQVLAGPDGLCALEMRRLFGLGEREIGDQVEWLRRRGECIAVRIPKLPGGGHKRYFRDMTAAQTWLDANSDRMKREAKRLKVIGRKESQLRQNEYRKQRRRNLGKPTFDDRSQYLGPTQAKMLEALRAAPGGMMAGEWAAAIGVTSGRVLGSLRKLRVRQPDVVVERKTRGGKMYYSDASKITEMHEEPVSVRSGRPPHIQLKGERRASIIKRLEAAGSAGVGGAELGTRRDREEAHEMHCAGLIFSRRDGYSKRHFLTVDWADKFDAIRRTGSNAAKNERRAAKRAAVRVPKYGATQPTPDKPSKPATVTVKSSGKPVGEAIIPKGLKPIEGPHWTHDPRYMVAPGTKVSGEFSQLGIGRYVLEPA